MLSAETVPHLLVNNLPLALVHAIEDALIVGARRAHKTAAGMDRGHLAHVLGQQRHFLMNETFHSALVAGDAAPTPIRGNGVISGRSGIFQLARFNIGLGMWSNGRRSATRQQMALANRELERLVQPDLFGERGPITTGTIFFVSCFTPANYSASQEPASIAVAVPNPRMTGWLFREDVTAFAARYNQAAPQEDNVNIKLKPNVKRDAEPDAAAL